MTSFLAQFTVPGASQAQAEGGEERLQGV